MPETSKNKWIAVLVAIVIVAFFFGIYFLTSFNSNVNKSISNIDSPNNQNIMTSTSSDSSLNNPSAQAVAGPSASVAESNNSSVIKKTTLADGLIIEDQVIGTGTEAVVGKTVDVNYIGTLENGKKFDSSYDRGQPIEFGLGSGQVIKGWDEGIAGMKVGGKRKLIIPAVLGYGNQDVGNGLIPANSTLIFDVELVAVK